MMFCKKPLRMVALALLGGSLVSGCGSISLVKPTPAADIYDIAQLPVDTDQISTVDWRLVVEEPLAPRAINTDRILIKTGPHVVQYVASVRWSERTPDLIHSHLIKAFEDSGKIKSVGREVTGLRRDYELKSEIRQFQIEKFKGDPRIKIEVSFKLVAYPSAQVVDAKVVSVTQPIESVRMAKVVNGFDAALGAVVSEAVTWTLTAVPGSEGSSDRGTPKRFDPIEKELGEVTDGAAEE